MSNAVKSVNSLTTGIVDFPICYGIVGDSPEISGVLRDIEKAANSDVPVVVTGESGTGKELIASAVHTLSDRADGPFQVINCASIPENLIHAELFGHEKGAFTGAHERRIGRFEAASNGTLFLDEVGELPLELQATLLRVLQEQRFERLGSNRAVSVDVRIVAATNVDLESAVKEGRFREDLYYRLSVVRLKVPPVRERGRDAEHLAHYLLNDVASENSSPRLSSEALTAIRQYGWPGNVREMRNRIRRAVLFSEDGYITPDDLELDSAISGPRATLAEIRHEAERKAICSALERHRNVTRAARELDVSRVTLYRLMEKHGVSVERQAGLVFDPS